MEEAFDLGEYLPLSFKTPTEADYIAFLWDAFQSNYGNEKFQFAFLAYHMLTMCCIYFNIWQIKQNISADFERGLIGFPRDIENELLSATSPFDFSTVSETGLTTAITRAPF